jgi:hypothetical protein
MLLDQGFTWSLWVYTGGLLKMLLPTNRFNTVIGPTPDDGQIESLVSRWVLDRAW